jgi:hypothetical protein
MIGDGLFNLDRRDVLSAGDDDVLLAIAKLDVPLLFELAVVGRCRGNGCPAQ